MKIFSIHTSWCPEDCTYGWTVDKLVESFKIEKEEIEDLGVGGRFEITCDLTLCRDK